MAKRVNVTTAQKAARMSTADLQKAYQREYKNYKDNLRNAAKKGADISGYRNFPTPADFKGASKAQKARIMGNLSSYRAETGTAAKIVERQQRTFDALKGGGYGDYFDDMSPEDFSQDRFGRFMQAARAAWEGGRRTFDSGVAVQLFGIMEENNYSIRMFKANMSELLNAAVSGMINADNAGIAGKSFRAQTMARTEQAFSAWGIR